MMIPSPGGNQKISMSVEDADAWDKAAAFEREQRRLRRGSALVFAASVVIFSLIITFSWIYLYS
ncbi:hypothetical protein [Corynebacterium parakroppenstedtii]|uniref:hypothetical protein n=1 Tax=Corynebacterium parakroppenstedtii TaxID=2828363 RepID=UPI001C8E29FF|nr:hypothetical protein [Corynebacterium parakroppenstedtii]MBY0797333.1 hypothetical protein [Corynebacterium parakroppenstedtii]